MTAQSRPPLRCPKCGCVDRLVLIEVHAEVGVTASGTIRRTETGALLPPTAFYFEPGDPISVHVECEKCDHRWAPRRGVVAYDPDAPNPWRDRA